jgi:hypothetical protein
VTVFGNRATDLFERRPELGSSALSSAVDEVEELLDAVLLGATLIGRTGDALNALVVVVLGTRALLRLAALLLELLLGIDNLLLFLLLLFLLLLFLFLLSGLLLGLLGRLLGRSLLLLGRFDGGLLLSITNHQHLSCKFNSRTIDCLRIIPANSAPPHVIRKQQTYRRLLSRSLRLGRHPRRGGLDQVGNGIPEAHRESTRASIERGVIERKRVQGEELKVIVTARRWSFRQQKSGKAKIVRASPIARF